MAEAQSLRRWRQHEPLRGGGPSWAVSPAQDRINEAIQRGDSETAIRLLARGGHRERLLLQYITTRQEQSIGPATYKYELSMLSRAYTLAIQAGNLDHKPHFPKVEVHNTRERSFTEAEFESVLSRLPAEVQPLIEFLWLTEWRVHAEAKVLQWPQVNWTTGSLRLWDGTTKNGKSREVPFWNYPRLKSLLERQRACTKRVERAKSMIVPWVFHRDGKPIKSFRGAWEKACTEAGLPGARVHDFRRCVVRRFEHCHVPRSAAMKVTGHKTETVYRRYMITTAEDVLMRSERSRITRKSPIQAKHRQSRHLERLPDNHADPG